jgi:hypothetical protein
VARVNPDNVKEPELQEECDQYCSAKSRVAKGDWLHRYVHGCPTKMGRSDGACPLLRRTIAKRCGKRGQAPWPQPQHRCAERGWATEPVPVFREPSAVVLGALLLNPSVTLSRRPQNVPLTKRNSDSLSRSWCVQAHILPNLSIANSSCAAPRLQIVVRLAVAIQFFLRVSSSCDLTGVTVARCRSTAAAISVSASGWVAAMSNRSDGSWPKSNNSGGSCLTGGSGP